MTFTRQDPSDHRFPSIRDPTLDPMITPHQRPITQEAPMNTKIANSRSYG